MQRSDDKTSQTGQTGHDEHAQPGRLVVIGEDECWDLARTRPVGRLAWQGAQGVSVIPVNFAIEDREVLLRTTPYSLMARDCVDREVAFEIDMLDEHDHSGWSVLLRGRCQRSERLPAGGAPWATGPRVLALRMEVHTVTGRRLVPAASGA